MKKLFTTICFFTLANFAASAQSEVLFKMKIMPDKHYAILINMDMNMLMNTKGAPAPVKKKTKTGATKPTAAKPTAAKPPIVMDMLVGFDMDLKTKALTAAGTFPFTMDLKPTKMAMNMNGKASPVPMPATESTMFGTYSTNGVLSIDSVAGQKTTETAKALSEKMMGSLQTNIQFPDKPMKVGDTFTQDVPMNMPMAGALAGIQAKSVYTLTAINGDKAYFDVKYDMNLDTKIQGMMMNMSGGGDGKMVYSIAANYATSMLMTINIKYLMNMPQAANTKMDCKMKMQMEYTTVITDN